MAHVAQRLMVKEWPKLVERWEGYTVMARVYVDRREAPIMADM